MAGRKKKCIKGKSCGLSCIPLARTCRIKLNSQVSREIGQAASMAVRDIMKGLYGPEATPEPQTKEWLPPGLPSKTQEVLEDVSRILKGEDPLVGTATQVTSDKERKKVREDLQSMLYMVGDNKTSTILQRADREISDLRWERNGISDPVEREALAAKAEKIKNAAGQLRGTDATGNTVWAREDAEHFDRTLSKALRREGNEQFDGWKDSFSKGSYSIGGGSYGTVIRNPDGTFVKRGTLSDDEARIMAKVGEAGIGPRMIAADINGRDTRMVRPDNHVEFRVGRIAMTKVEGQPIGDLPNDSRYGGMSKYDIYWKSMAQLHRIGVAHNDAHSENILVDGGGKGRWVDFGLAQDNPKAALAEAMGVFPAPKGVLPSRSPSAVGTKGNWQTKRSTSSGVKEAEKAKKASPARWEKFSRENPATARFWDNKLVAEARLYELGLTRGEVAGIIAHGIRTPAKSFEEGPWKKLSNSQALEVLNLLYDGL